jgi:transcriptional regulator with XRE-family HTH domain
MTTEADIKFTPAEVKLIRIRLGETQAQFARRIGVHRQTIADYEAGKIKPKSGPVLGALLRAREATAAPPGPGGSQPFEYTVQDRFYETASIGELSRAQGVKPVTRRALERAPFWPEEDDPDDVVVFLKALDQPTK